MLRNNTDVCRCLYFELGLPVVYIDSVKGHLKYCEVQGFGERGKALPYLAKIGRVATLCLRLTSILESLKAKGSEWDLLVAIKRPRSRLKT